MFRFHSNSILEKNKISQKREKEKDCILTRSATKFVDENFVQPVSRLHQRLMCWTPTDRQNRSKLKENRTKKAILITAEDDTQLCTHEEEEKLVRSSQQHQTLLCSLSLSFKP
jgi:hypothetical protein